MVVKVVVTGLGVGGNMVINLCDTEEQFKSITVLQLKEKIKERFPIRQPETVRLTFQGRYLDEDSSLLSAYGIKHMSVIQAVVEQPGGTGGLELGRGVGGRDERRPCI